MDAGSKWLMTQSRWRGAKQNGWLRRMTLQRMTWRLLAAAGDVGLLAAGEANCWPLSGGRKMLAAGNAKLRAANSTMAAGCWQSKDAGCWEGKGCGLLTKQSCKLLAGNGCRPLRNNDEAKRPSGGRPLLRIGYQITNHNHICAHKHTIDNTATHFKTTNATQHYSKQTSTPHTTTQNAPPRRTALRALPKPADAQLRAASR